MNKQLTQSPPNLKLAGLEQKKEESWEMKYLRSLDRIMTLLEKDDNKEKEHKCKCHQPQHD